MIDNDELKKNGILFTPWKDDEKKTTAGASFYDKVFIDSNLEEDIFIVPGKHVAKHRNVPVVELGGWLINIKSLKFHRIKLSLYRELLNSGVKEIDKFDDIEKLCEEFKHRFASKKFGI